MNAKQIQAGKRIADELVGIKAQLGALGLFKTMHALDAATKAIGYELAEKCEEIGQITTSEKNRRAHMAINHPKEFAREQRRAFRQ